MSIKGFDKFQKQLKQMHKAAKELEKKDSYTAEDIFTTEFMEKYTDFSSFDELLEKSGYTVKSQEDFEKIPDDEFDEYIAKTTRFNSWREMQEAALEIYVADQLGF